MLNLLINPLLNSLVMTIEAWKIDDFRLMPVDDDISESKLVLIKRDRCRSTGMPIDWDSVAIDWDADRLGFSGDRPAPAQTPQPAPHHRFGDKFGKYPFIINQAQITIEAKKSAKQRTNTAPRKQQSSLWPKSSELTSEPPTPALP
ncbi:MAG: hypothetical protein EA001_09510 [Oscillatoriales cyanobacterium]|nr:MAG: hypothetical protein EA001_09510 [Oscillatoriales cyanobacterium]